jgi:hypothetical protein
VPESAADSLRLELEAPAEVPAGAVVTIRLRLRNTGAEPAVVYLLGRAITFDIVITRVDGDTVWRRLSGEPVQAIIQVRQLEPGGELLLEDVWDQRDRAGKPVPPGDYRVRGLLFTDQPAPWATEPATLRIIPPRRQ